MIIEKYNFYDSILSIYKWPFWAFFHKSLRFFKSSKNNNSCTCSFKFNICCIEALLTIAWLHLSDSVMSEWTVDVDRRIYKGIQSGMDRGFIQKGDPVIIITGWKPGSGSTNTMRIINAVDVANKDLLAPITGNPSFWLCCYCCN